MSKDPRLFKMATLLAEKSNMYVVERDEVIFKHKNQRGNMSTIMTVPKKDFSDMIIGRVQCYDAKNGGLRRFSDVLGTMDKMFTASRYRELQNWTKRIAERTDGYRKEQDKIVFSTHISSSSDVTKDVLTLSRNDFDDVYNYGFYMNDAKRISGKDVLKHKEFILSKDYTSIGEKVSDGNISSMIDDWFSKEDDLEP